jgi:hypothetical protein
MADNIQTKPRVNINCINITSGKAIRLLVNGISNMIKATNATRKLKNKFITPAVVVASGNIIRGKYTFFTKLEWAIINPVPVCVEVAKNSQGSKATNKNIGYLSTFIRNMVENTAENTINCSRGFT